SMIEDISKKRIPHERSQITDHLTVSVGVASIMPANDENWEQLISKADQALYLSKAKGRNQAKLYSAVN
ncbi:MAG: diguanylate cyclase, partial [Gammaproteobacteria bacterium]|nr:diguanylate cyclase [Gammaproteobacteria bacterium]NNJ90989.1 diguanylate cyclase [Gammaproteobacteria bacterium]